MLHAVLTLTSVQACKGYTIAQLKQRLVPDGLRYTPGRSMEELCLDK